MLSFKAIFSTKPKEVGECLGDSFVPEAMRDDAELLRRARLQIRFGGMGAIFGTLYATFYYLIGHPYGGTVIVFCSTDFFGLHPQGSRAKARNDAESSRWNASSS